MFGLVRARHHEAAVDNYRAAMEELSLRLQEAYNQHLNDLAHAERARIRLAARLDRAIRGCARYRSDSASHVYLVRFLCGCLLDASSGSGASTADIRACEQLAKILAAPARGPEADPP